MNLKRFQQLRDKIESLKAVKSRNEGALEQLTSAMNGEFKRLLKKMEARLRAAELKLEGELTEFDETWSNKLEC